MHIKSDNIKDKLEESGVAQISLIPDEGVLSELKSFYQEIGPAKKEEEFVFQSTMFADDPEYRKKVNEFLIPILQKHLDTHFDGYRILFTNYIEKQPSLETKVNAHQDWTFVDEEKYRAFIVWIPLVNIDPTTGPFFALERSQMLFKNTRYTPAPNYKYQEIAPLVEHYATKFEPNPGEAIIYDSALVHYSQPNLSVESRLAIGLTIVPENADTFHFYSEDDEHLQVFKTDREFYNHFDFSGKPQSELIKTIPPAHSFPTLHEIRTFYQKSILTDQLPDAKLKEDGHCLVSNFLDEEQMSRLLKFCEENMASNHEDDFQISNWTDKETYREEAHKIIIDVFKHYEDIIPGYEPVLGCFAIKKPGMKSHMILHQDWSLVDERFDTSLSIWVPLVDTNYKNGAFSYIEDSNKFADFPRGVNTPNILDENAALLLKKGKHITQKKGDALLFDHRLIHYSPPNLTDTTRPVAILALIPKQSKLFHFYKYPDNKKGIEVLEIDKPVFHKINFFDHPNKPPHIASWRRMEYDFDLKKQKIRDHLIKETQEPVSIKPSKADILMDEALNKQLSDEGYVVLKRQFPKDRIDELWDIYHEKMQPNELDIPFHTLHWIADHDVKKSIHNELVPIINEALQKQLSEAYDNIFSYFLIKKASPEGKFGVHQDWAIIDESKYTGVTAWIPLQDTTKANGCFQVFPGSHLLTKNIRGLNLTPEYNGMEETIENEYLVDVEMEVGDILLFDHRMIHASPPNLSATSRVAVGAVLIPKEADAYLYVGHEKYGDVQKLAVFKANRDFLLNSYYNYQDPSNLEIDINELQFVKEMTQKDKMAPIDLPEVAAVK